MTHKNELIKLLEKQKTELLSFASDLPLQQDHLFNSVVLAVVNMHIELTDIIDESKVKSSTMNPDAKPELFTRGFCEELIK